MLEWLELQLYALPAAVWIAAVGILYLLNRAEYRSYLQIGSGEAAKRQRDKVLTVGQVASLLMMFVPLWILGTAVYAILGLNIASGLLILFLCVVAGLFEYAARGMWLERLESQMNREIEKLE